MNVLIRHIFVSLVFLGGVFDVTGIYADTKSDMMIITECDKDVYYSNETGKATVWLYTTNPNISGFNEVSPISLDKGEFSYIAKIANVPPYGRKRIKNKDYYAIPLAVYAFMIKSPGKHNLLAGDYKIGVDEPIIVRDPWFGNVASHRTSVVDLEGVKASIKVKRLPDAKENSSFNGAVGSYDINVMVPRGDIIINEPASLVITIKGTGMIGDDTMPDYHKAFMEGNKLKSMSEKNDYYYDGNNLVSQKVLECEFIPTDKDNCIIGPVEFSFFNPQTGKYETVKSDPIKIEVKSSTAKLTPYDI
ncbi:MAG: BatD family protein [Muribaculaceae bacterium]|nr:BatD family protein [Muribaculaceae bacterium]